MKKIVSLLAFASVALGLCGLIFGITTLGHAIVLTVAGTILLVLEIGGLRIACLLFNSLVTVLATINIVVYKLFIHDHKTPQEAK